MEKVKNTTDKKIAPIGENKADKSNYLRVGKVKKSIITKNITDFQVDTSIAKTHRPKAGDVGLFKVLEIGKHKAIQGENGTNRYIFEGDSILCAFGTRYATEQFEGYVPSGYKERFEILGQGGVVGELASMHSKFKDIGATTVELIGYATDGSGKVLNTIDHFEARHPKPKSPDTRNRIFLSVGSSMDSGKTTTAGFFCRGASLLGKKAGFIKLTGTVYAKDCSFVRDCGAATAIDFSYCGYPSTYLVGISEIKRILYALLRRVNRMDLDYVMVEIADGLYQKETNQLLSDEEFMDLVDGGVILSCADSLAVKSGIDFLASKNISPIALSGLFTASPLLMGEVGTITDIPVFDLDSFLEAGKMSKLLT